jgi:class 3 adenylate cyclase
MIRGEKVTGDHFDHAAVLFIDVAGFTTHTAAMHPGDVVQLLEDLFSRMDSICDRHSAVKIKTIGDSYMCFRGDGTQAENALSIAHLALDVARTPFAWPDGSPLVVRMGAHIGPATAGVIGTQRLQYDVWGDTVNVASRMESHGEPGRVHVSEAFAAALRLNDSMTPDSMALLKRGSIAVKGKGEMTTYWLE